MQNLLLLIVLILGLGGGYFAGNYGSKDCKKALESTKAAADSAESALQSSLKARDKSLAELNEKYSLDVAKLTKDQQDKDAAWEQAKVERADLIKGLNTQIAGLKNKYPDITKKLNQATGDEKKQIEKSITLLSSEIDRLQTEVEGNVCLSKPIPKSVFAALKVEGN